jgi:hypothetical protein
MGQMGRALALWLFEQGVTEDACGVSLEARWLSRTSEPTHPGRISRSSSPGSWPEPPSGVRAISGKLGAKLGHATTVDVSKSAGTPVALTSAKPVVSARERRAYLLAAAALIVAALAIAWLGLSRGQVAQDRPALPPSAAVPAVPANDARPEPAVARAPQAPTPAPAGTARLENAVAEAPAKVEARGAAPKPVVPAAVVKPAHSEPAPAAAPVPSAAPAPAAPAKPASDLLAPY